MKGHDDFLISNIAQSVFNETREVLRLSKWLSTNAYTITVPPLSPSEFILDDPTNSIPSVINGEVRRFSSAVFESIRSSFRKKDINDTSYAWNLIALYYASFYSAHALLRLTGVFCSQVNDTSHLIRDFQSFTGYTGVIEKGFYLIKFDHKQKKAFFKKASLSNAYGSHQFLWHTFRSEFKNIYSNKNLSTQSHELARKEWDEFASKIQGQGNSQWLPNFRNEINYRLPSEIWYPFSLKIKIYSEIADCLSAFDWHTTISGMKHKNEYIRFASCCLFPCQLLHIALSQISMRAPNKIRNPILKSIKSIKQKLDSPELKRAKFAEILI